jgi:hypothetical protein
MRFRLGYLLTPGDFHGGAEAFDLRKRTNWPEALVNLGLSY